MSLTLYTSVYWGIEKQTVFANGQLDSPTLLSVTSLGPNQIRLTFDRDMRQELSQNIANREGTLLITSYTIAAVVSGDPLSVIRTIRVDETHLDLLTEDQEDGVLYRVTTVPGGAMDAAGNVITEQTADFTGIGQLAYPTPTDLNTFSSGYPGMQEDLLEDFYPDLNAPYLQNRNPGPGDTGIDPASHIYLEIVDDDEGVDLSSVLIWVQGSLAYRGDTNTFLAPFDGPMSAVVHVGNAYQVTLDRSSSFADYLTVSVRVYADDLAPIINTLDTTYSFQTWDHSAPFVDAHAPTGVGVSKSTLITFSVADAGIGVDLATMNVTVAGVPAISSGVLSAGFNGPGSSIVVDGTGYNVTLQKDTNYDSYETVNVYLSVKDLLGNTLTYNWSFEVEDYAGPLIHPVNPTNGQNDVPQDTDIVVEVTDEQSLVANSVRVRINVGSGWVIAYQQGDTPAFKPGYDGPGSGVVAISGGYRITIDPVVDFEVSTIVSVEVSAADPEGNPERLG